MCQTTHVPVLLQVWNLNACGAVVGVFNIQGSSWDRRRRRFHTHDVAPPVLTAAVRPLDVPGLADGSHMFAAYSDRTKVRGGRRELADAYSLALWKWLTNTTWLRPKTFGELSN
jgi:hypothetical protein